MYSASQSNTRICKAHFMLMMGLYNLLVGPAFSTPFHGCPPPTFDDPGIETTADNNSATAGSDSDDEEKQEEQEENESYSLWYVHLLRNEKIMNCYNCDHFNCEVTIYFGILNQL